MIPDDKYIYLSGTSSATASVAGAAAIVRNVSSDCMKPYANKAPNEDLARAELEILKDKWGKKYPYAISNWESNWNVVSPFFSFSDDIR